MYSTTVSALGDYVLNPSYTRLRIVSYPDPDFHSFADGLHHRYVSGDVIHPRNCENLGLGTRLVFVCHELAKRCIYYVHVNLLINCRSVPSMPKVKKNRRRLYTAKNKEWI